MRIDPNEMPVPQLHGYLLGTVAPRPIAFASTTDKNGNVNLSPFSFFNVFGANPPIMIFSPARRGRDNTVKHTYENVLEHPEAVVNVVSHEIVEQMSLTSTEYERGINEFIKGGLTPVKSEKIQPPRVKESPVSFECKVVEVKPLGDKGGAGNLVICEVVLIHIADRVLDNEGRIDPNKIDLVGRMGGNWYSRASGKDIFEVKAPDTMGIGVDQIPDHIRKSCILTGNHLGQLGNVEALPSKKEVEQFAGKPEVSSILDSFMPDNDRLRNELHTLAVNYLDQNEVLNAWKVLLQESLV